jgi:hypothetical protein
MLMMGMLLLVTPSCISAQECPAPELVVGARDYNVLVCSAIAALDRGEYSKAVVSLGQVTRMSLHEYPNFRALPRLAIAYARSGRPEDARRTLDEAALSLEVYFGIARCRETADGFDIVLPSRSFRSEATARVVATRMCGEAYDSVYEQASIESLVSDLPLLEVFAEARTLISP